MLKRKDGESMALGYLNKVDEHITVFKANLQESIIFYDNAAICLIREGRKEIWVHFNYNDIFEKLPLVEELYKGYEVKHTMQLFTISFWGDPLQEALRNEKELHD